MSENELTVLRAFVVDPMASNVAVAGEMGLSAAGVGKIRAKLEKMGVVRGYKADVDMGALGLNAFVILHVKITSEGWRFKGHKGVESLLLSNSNIMGVYRVSGRSVTHVLICAFRSVREVDVFLHAVQAQLSEYVEVVESFVFSGEGMLKNSCRDVLLKVIDEGEEKRMPEPVLFGLIVGDDK
ncbi:MAG: Lrp/AsnC family transcriptional regulator [Desulfobacteraceae bacterium]|nr:Lrp/AsnC family transcriptional regulator [Desulfobacteraceae bacterium]